MNTKIDVYVNKILRLQDGIKNIKKNNFKNCPSFGNEISLPVTCCPNCGKNLNPKKEYQQSSSASNFVTGLLSFLIPIVGIIIFFVYRETKLDKAQAGLIGALIAIGLIFVFPCMMN